MDKTNNQNNSKARYIPLYIACIFICVLNVLLTGEQSRKLLTFLSIAYGVTSYIVVKSAWKPNIALFFYCSICALLVKWYEIGQSVPLILIEPIISLLFSAYTHTIFKAILPSPNLQAKEIIKSSWIHKNRTGLEITLVSNLTFFFLFIIDADLFELQSGLLFVYIFLLYPLSGLFLGITSYTRTKRFAGICAIFLCISLHIPIFSSLLCIFINELYIIIGITASAFVIIGYLLGIFGGVMAKVISYKKCK